MNLKRLYLIECYELLLLAYDYFLRKSTSEKT